MVIFVLKANTGMRGLEVLFSCVVFFFLFVCPGGVGNQALLLRPAKQISLKDYSIFAREDLHCITRRKHSDSDSGVEAVFCVTGRMYGFVVFSSQLAKENMFAFLASAVVLVLQKDFLDRSPR